MVTAIGWGRTDFSSGNVNELREVTVPVLDDQDAEDYYGGTIDFSTKICIDAAGGHGTCNGDSGGPLVITDDADQAQVGITSFGSSAGCTSGAPDCFTAVPSYLDWIADNSKTSV